MFLDWLDSHLLVSFHHFAVVFFVVLVAFIIFGISGFGTALIASPILALYIPLSDIIALLALMDFTAAIIKAIRNRKDANKTELKRLIPLLIGGSFIGAIILLFVKPKILVLVLSLFVIAYSLYSLCNFKKSKHLSVKACYPLGIIGGIFSALFGSGGFLYAIYLTGRLKTKEAIRSTMSVVISLSTLTRTILFLIAGVYSNLIIVTTAICLAPAMLLGIYIGKHITLKMSYQLFIRFINCLILLSGIFLLVKFFISK